MSRSYGLPIIAVVGWLNFNFLAYAQQDGSPTLESQPVPNSQPENASGAGSDPNAQKQTPTEPLVPALEKIESAIRNLVAPPDEGKDERQARRDDDDLKAQQAMAVWAFWMFLATAASVVATFLGLALIARTLHHTRRAADYARDMVIEAEKATKAAIDAAKASTDAAEGQKRTEMAYILVEQVRVTSDIFATNKKKDIAFNLAMTFRNVGKTPGFAHKVKVFFAPTGWAKQGQAGNAAIGREAELGFFLPSNDRRICTNHFGLIRIDHSDLAAIKSGRLQAVIDGEVTFDNIQGETWVSGFSYRINFSEKANQKNVHLGGSKQWYFKKQNT